MITKVGLDTSSGSAPRPAAMPRTKAVLPAPRSPCSSTNVPGARVSASVLPIANVSCSELVVRISGLAIGRLHAAARGHIEHGVAEMCRQVARGHRHFAFVGFREVAGE